MDTHLESPIISPPMPMMGAKHIRRRPMERNVCTWVMSLVVRVMRLAVENWSSSPVVK